MYIEPYAKDNWHDDRLIHIPTYVKNLQDLISDLEWEGKDVTNQTKEIVNMMTYMDKTGQEFYPKF